MNNGLIIVISGPAGSGKGTVVKELLKNEDYILSVSRTTRSPRPYETDGVEYHFVTGEAFEAYIKEGDFLEYAEYCGNRYGTPRRAAEKAIAEGKNVLLEIEVMGAEQIRKNYPDAVFILLLPPSFKVQEARLRGRDTESDEVIAKRLERTREEMKYVGLYDYVVRNDDGEIDNAVADILSIIKAEKMSVKRNPDTKEKYFAD